MKKVLALLSILFVLFSCSKSTVDTNICHNVERTNVYEINVLYTSGEPTRLYVVIIDSCEYIIGKSGIGYQGYGYLSHKGNCKYCTERKKRELQKYFENTK